MKNVTITLPDDLARWVRVRAAEDGHSVSRWVADLLAGMRRGEDEHEVAMREFLAVKPRRMEWVDGRRPTREELHDRAGFADAKPSTDPGGALTQDSCHTVFMAGRLGEPS